jgi:hypothetical protein
VCSPSTSAAICRHRSFFGIDSSTVFATSNSVVFWAIVQPSVESNGSMAESAAGSAAALGVLFDGVFGLSSLHR